jgi:dipeptidase E
MPKLYLLGGENIYRKSASKVNEKAFKDAGEPLSVLIFPWARASFDSNYRKRKILSDYFLSLGANLIDFIEFSDPVETITQKMGSSKLIYLTGGLVTALIERLKKAHVDELLRTYPGVIVGRSAGALALCKRCIVTSRWQQKVMVTEGLGMADLTMKAHYRPKKDQTLTLLSRKEKIYAVPSKSAIVYENGICSIIGKVYLFENGEKSELKSFS